MIGCATQKSIIRSVIMFPLFKKSSPSGSPSKAHLSFRFMEEKDLEMVMNWCKEEKWNVGMYDAAAYYALDSKGHFLFLLDKKPIGAISMVKYSHNLFAIGAFIVKKEYRNKGFGSQIWHYAIEILKKNNNATSCLYSVPAQISRYAASGFQSDFHIQRWKKSFIKQPTSKMEESTTNLKQLNSIPIESIIEYDQSIFSVSRKKLLAKFIQNENIVGFASTDDSGQITGFGLIRPCINGYRIGPLYADHIGNAQKLFQTLLNNVNSTVFIDAPSHNPHIEQFASYFNLERVSKEDTAAMFRREVPDSLRTNNHKNYAICSLEVG
ncbi:MAG: GNAT family N-acetyltransferase [Gammaproteobacteria bacterium]|nr:MAG: GNAT family N-acetyltransferase [Gammaproteobacteria bacterium]